MRAAINGVLREGAIAAALTGLMILLFLGSWRSTLIVCISIPLSILTSLIVLSLLGETVNVMTLGGLALAVGILVDDATVEIENIHRNMGMRKPITRAILDGAQQIAVPAFVSTLSICIVFVPVLLLTGAAKFLFTPLAMAVVFAMLTSYLLSRTLVPTMVHHMLQGRSGDVPAGRGEGDRSTEARAKSACDLACARRFQPPIRKMRKRYRGALDWSLDHRAWIAGFSASSSSARWSGACRGPRFLPVRGFRPDAPARPRSRRHAHRGDRTYLRPVEREIRHSDSSQRDLDNPR